MQLITYQGRLAALAGTERVYLAAHLDRRADTDATKQFVLRLTLYAHQLEHHQLPDEPIRYLAARAHQYVREQLMPADEFLACAQLTNRELATLFGAPIEQVSTRRRELHAPGPSVRSHRPRTTLVSRRARICS